MTSRSSASAHPAQYERAGPRQRLGLALLVVPTLLLAADITVLYLALPHLSVDLGPTSTETLWIIDIYGFLLAGFLITLGDRIGRRRLLMAGAVTFGLAALLAAYATGPEALIAARALMGVASATLLPSTLSLIANMFQDPAQRTQAIGALSVAYPGGSACEPRDANRHVGIQSTSNGRPAERGAAHGQSLWPRPVSSAYGQRHGHSPPRHGAPVGWASDGGLGALGQGAPSGEADLAGQGPPPAAPHPPARREVT